MEEQTNQDLINTGVALFGAKRFPAAVAAFEHAVQADPDNATAWKGLGYALAASGRAEEATQALGRSVAIEPHDADTRYGFGLALLAAGKPGRALEQLEECVDLDPENLAAQEAFTDLAVSHGRKLLDQGLVPNAEHWFRAAVEADPGCVDAHIGLIGLLANDGDVTEARILFERLALRRPDLPELEGLASVLGLSRTSAPGWS